MFSKYFLTALVAAVVAFSATNAEAAMSPRPARTTMGSTANYATFHDRLAAHGSWIRSERWGDVWRPGIAGFRPYFDRGHWAYTADYGWYWNADDDWGDVVTHYGRWVFEPGEGWVWIPGYVWGPSWVAWRWGNGYAGWMPEPPDYAFLSGGIDIGVNFGSWDVGFYGYRGWYGGAVAPADLWVFVGGGHLVDPGFARFAVPRVQVASFIVRTRNVTSYSLHNGFVVNRGVSVRDVERVSGHTIMRVSPATLAHNDFVPTRASVGHTIATHELAAHPVATTAMRSTATVHRTVTAHATTQAARTASVHRTTTHVARTTSVHHTQHGLTTRTAHTTTHTRTVSRSHSSVHRSYAYHAPYHASGFARQSSHPSAGTHGGAAAHAPAPHPSGGHGAPPAPNSHKPG